MTTNTDIRLATLEDWLDLNILAAKFLHESPHGALIGQHAPAALPAFVEWMLEHGTTFVASVDGQVVGMLAVVRCTIPMTGQACVEEVAWYVDTAHRAGTLGPRLLAAVTRWARTDDSVVLKMLAPSGSGVGRYLERRGFAALETTYVKVLEAIDVPVHEQTESASDHGAGPDERRGDRT